MVNRAPVFEDVMVEGGEEKHDLEEDYYEEEELEEEDQLNEEFDEPVLETQEEREKFYQEVCGSPMKGMRISLPVDSS